MNISEANAVNVVVRALVGISHPFTGELPTTDEQQVAVDLLLRGAGLAPGQVVIEEVTR